MVEEAPVRDSRTTRWLLGAVLMSLLVVARRPAAGEFAQGSGATSPQVQPPSQQELQKLSEQDHQRMMDLLHITTLRHGADGDSKSPYAANYDDSKAGTFRLPDPLVLKNGKPVKTAADWWTKRRPEIVED